MGCFGRATAVHKNGGSQVQGHRPLLPFPSRWPGCCYCYRRHHCRRRRRRCSAILARATATASASAYIHSRPSIAIYIHVGRITPVAYQVRPSVGPSNYGVGGRVSELDRSAYSSENSTAPYMYATYVYRSTHYVSSWFIVSCVSCTSYR